jgi:hypothetical protein
MQISLLELDEEGSIWFHPQAVLDQHKCRLHQCTVKEVLVQWKNTTPKDATWKLPTIMQQFPHLKP